MSWAAFGCILDNSAPTSGISEYVASFLMSSVKNMLETTDKSYSANSIKPNPYALQSWRAVSNEVTIINTASILPSWRIADTAFL